MSQPPQLCIIGTSICFGAQKVSPEALADALARYLQPTRRTKRTLEIEQQAATLIKDTFADHKATAAFIRKVCWWGGYAGISGRVLDPHHNAPATIRNRLRAAQAAMGEQPPNLQTAIREVRSIHSLGLSFASKHLRMLWPKHCPVLDSQIHKHLQYAMNSTGYCAFAGDCRAVADFLSQQKTPNPARDGQSVWYVADVEAAVFMLLGR